MTDLVAQNIPFYWATVFFRKLLKDGVRQVIISPGSRSTPLTMAAAANPYLKKQVILDERTAAFTALGVGKATGIPAVLICTSGTAAANYYPAVIEARQSGIPMILATADRPPHLRATGANQAIDQLKLFGDYPVFFHEVGEPRMENKDLDRLEMLARQAIGTAQQKRGPVHLNFPFRKPLEPTPSFVKETEARNKQESSIPAKQAGTREQFHIPESVQQVIANTRCPLIITGPAAPQDDSQSIAQLAERLNAPVLAESTLKSGRTISGFAGFLRNPKTIETLEPDLILRFGFQPTSKSLEEALKTWQPDHHFHFASTPDWQDATYSVSTHLPWLGKPFSVESITSSTEDVWIQTWKELKEKFETHRNQAFSKTETLTDGHIYHHLLPQCSGDHFIAVSNSFPARDIQLFGQNGIQHPLFLNRGASGIDGITSTAIGISLGYQQPGVLFTGDLAFLHDTNALLNQQILDENLTVIVINNSGGAIFRMLPVEQHEEYFQHYFETPQSADLQHLTRTYDIPFHRMSRLAELEDFNLDTWQARNPGLSVVECQTDPDASMQLRRQLWNYAP